MSIYEISAFLREMSIQMEILLVQHSTDLEDIDLYNTYMEWVESKKWLIDLSWGEAYCLN